MSLDNWKKEFVQEIPSTSNDVLGIIKRDIMMWQGCTESNRFKHKIEVSGGSLRDFYSNIFGLGIKNSALCTYFYSTNCKKCPIVIVSKKTCNRAFDKWITSHNPNRMLNLLYKAYEGMKTNE